MHFSFGCLRGLGAWGDLSAVEAGDEVGLVFVELTTTARYVIFRTHWCVVSPNSSSG